MTNFNTLIAIILAVGGLGMAAMSLVDALKAVPGGGVSRIGFGHIRKVLRLFDKVLARAAGDQWEAVIMAHWINGRPRDEQIGVIRSLLRLGLSADTAPQLAEIGNVDPVALGKAAAMLVEGAPLGEDEINLIGRVETAVVARLDAGFDLAEQAYRNIARVMAGLIAVGLAVWAADLLSTPQARIDPWMAVFVGVLAVPIAPIAKDLVSALTAAAQAVKSTRGV
ncbi:hypothetical protein [Caulobacter soli]|uniref:hypothetical protein n=1 Tax=Caulobacter soli TaxID=2708539 RepID=UPI0013EAF295|nr:hypothetical protein [Caulobacter soli]